MATRKTNKSSQFTVRTLHEAAFVMGVSTRQVTEYIQRGCPGDRGKYPLPAMIAWAKENIWRSKNISPADPLLEGPATPSLERLRCVRADQEEIKLLEMRRELMPVSVLETLLSETSGLIRDAAANLERRFGPEAREEFDAVLTNFEQRCQREWGAAHVG